VDETLSIVLSKPQNVTLTDTTAQVVITNDDPVPALTISSRDIVEGNDGTTMLVFDVSLNGTSETNITVDFATSDGTAKSAGAMPDYLATMGTLTFAPGEMTKTISVPVLGDTIRESNESFTIVLSDPTGAV